LAELDFEFRKKVFRQNEPRQISWPAKIKPTEGGPHCQAEVYYNGIYKKSKSGSGLKGKGELLRLFQSSQLNIYVQVGPMKLVRAKTLNGVYLGYSRLSKGRIIFKGNKIFTIVDQQPKTVQANIGYFTVRNVDARQI
jgi:hypothetical protein